MDGGYCELVAAAPPPTPVNNNIKCSACGEAGHKLRTNKKFKFYSPRGNSSKKKPAPLAKEEQEDNPDADEQDLMDNVQFEESDDEFFDALEDDDDCDTSFLI